MITIGRGIGRTLGDSKSRRIGKRESGEDEIHLVLGENVAVDGSIRGKSFGGFYSIFNGSWLPVFELCVRY